MSNNQKFGERTVMSKIKERKLSEKERARLVRMREVTKVREDKGYQRKDQIMSVSFANVIAIILSIPFFIIFGVWFVSRNGWSNWLSVGCDVGPDCCS